MKKLTRYFAHCPYPVILAYLFGSHARGKTASLSDIDVAVLLDEEDSLESALIIYSDDRI